MTSKAQSPMIVKRDGTMVPFDLEKIKIAIAKALTATKLDPHPAELLSYQVQQQLRSEGTLTPGVEHVQNLVEKALMVGGYYDTARAYITYRNEHSKLRAERKPVSKELRALIDESRSYFASDYEYFIYLRTYSRYIESLGRRETWVETVERYMSFMRRQIGDKFSEEEYSELRQAILKMEIMPSMRLLQFAGPAAERNHLCAYNCCFVAPISLEDLRDIMYISMCGTGVGFSVEKWCVEQFPVIRHQTGEKLDTWAIQDSKEGWCDCFYAGLKAWYDGKDIDFDFSLIRLAGARLKVTGGTASGPDPLKELLKFSRSKILARQGGRLSTLEVHDLICKIGYIVVVGGVRRSALISLSDLEDKDLRDCKSGRFYDLHPYRCMANNSVVYNNVPDDSVLLEEWLALIKSGSGERGIFNRYAAIKTMPERRRALLGDRVHGTGGNPCISGSSMVLTSEGLRSVTSLVGKEFIAIVDGKPYRSTEKGFWSNGIKPVYRITLKSGQEIKATSNHLFLSKEKKGVYAWTEVSQLKEGSILSLSNNVDSKWEGGDGTYDEGYTMGQLIGDGTFCPNGKPNICLWLPPDYDIKQYKPAQIIERFARTLDSRSDFSGFGVVLRSRKYTKYNMGLTSMSAISSKWKIYRLEKVVPEGGSYDFTRGLLSGFFDADGTTVGSNKTGVSIRLTQVDLGRLQAVQRLLLALGIRSIIYRNRKPAGNKEMPDGKGGMKNYHCQELNELIISGDNIHRFQELIGFQDHWKKDKLQQRLATYKGNPRRVPFEFPIKSIQACGEEEVYDCTIPEMGYFSANGIITHNCNEILLQSHGLCNLTTIVARPYDTSHSLHRKISLATQLGTYQATLTDFKYVSPTFKLRAEEERLLGVSMTGQQECPILKDAALLQSLKAKALEVNALYSQRLGIARSTAITCVKPEGTVSEMVNAASGLHPRYYSRYLRRVRTSVHDPLTQLLREQGVPWHPEVGQTIANMSTVVFEFPIKAADGAITVKDSTALSMLEYWKLVKLNYTEHNPSITVNVAPDEWIPVLHWLKANWDHASGLSFLPKFDTVYQLTPYEEITEAEYLKRKAHMDSLHLDYAKLVYYETTDTTEVKRELACAGGVCMMDEAPKKAI